MYNCKNTLPRTPTGSPAKRAYLIWSSSEKKENSSLRFLMSFCARPGNPIDLSPHPQVEELAPADPCPSTVLGLAVL